MSRTFKDSQGRNGRQGKRRIIARGVKRRPLDYHKLSQALLALAEAQAEAEAQAQGNQVRAAQPDDPQVREPDQESA